MKNPYLAPRLPRKLPDDPMHWAAAWIEAAVEQKLQRNPNSMALVTTTPDGRPSARMVLCKQFRAEPGYLVFYTNYRSRKAQEIEANAEVAVLFHWDAIGRQVRIEGTAMRSPEAESDAYFASRDWGSQVGAWGSDQSAPLASRAALIAQVGKRALKLGINIASDLQSIAGDQRPAIERPPHWGGYRVWARHIELWVEGIDRIHDRARWSRELDADGDGGFNAGPWSGSRLQP